MLFVLICTDKQGALDLRRATRPAHLEYLRGHEGALVHAGAQIDDAGDPVGSVFILNVADRAEAEALAAGDPYAKAGLFQSVTLRGFREVFRDGAELA